MLRTALHFIGSLPGIQAGAPSVAAYYEEQQDMDEAIYWYQQAAHNGDVVSYFKCGQLHEYKKGNVTSAINAYFKGAIHSHAESLVCLARLADAGNEQAAFYLGRVWENRQEWQKALTYYTQAAAKNFSLAMVHIGWLYQQDRIALTTQSIAIKADPAQELIWYRRGAALYSAHALNSLYEASRNNPAACLHLAQMYEKGEGLSKNLGRMLEFLNQGEQQGDAVAAFHLGSWHETGIPEILAKNTRQAWGHYLLAAQRQYQPALVPLEKIALPLSDKEIDFAFAALFKTTFNNLPAAALWYKKASDKGHAQAPALLQQIADISEKNAYEIGQLYENNVPVNTAKAIGYYVLAMKKGHVEARKRIGALVTQDNADAQYAWGFDYHHNLKSDILEAVKWCLKAAEKNHPLALQYINKTIFSAEVYLKIANMYEISESITKNIVRAAEFLVKASDTGNQEASFRLGQWYESGSKTGIPKDLKKAGQYYLKAAKQNYSGALAALENITNLLKDSQLEYEVAAIYQNVIKNIAVALVWYKRAADHKHAQAATLLGQLAASSPPYAYEIGQMYEKNPPVNLPQVIHYYMLAAKKDHAQAKKRLEEIATSGNVDAQYALGYEYYQQHKGNILEAVKWCLKAAEKNHAQSLQYINKTVFTAEIYLKIAKMYESGEGISKNILRAAEFLVKASDAGNQEASFCLGQWYESGKQTGIAKDLKKASQYYLKAAKQNYSGALAALENVATLLKDAQLEYEIAAIYQIVSNNMSKALAGYKKAADQGHVQATAQLTQMANSTPQQAYEIGYLYEIGAPANFPQVIRHYMLAVKKEHVEAKKRLEEIATSGNVDAQYALGYEYYQQHKGNILEAVKWCVKAAEKNHAQSLQYINKTVFTAEIYLKIAKMYETGDGVSKNILRAAEFLAKASDAGNQEASFCLGQWYENGNQTGIAKDLKKASQYYLKAAKQNYNGAMAALENVTTQLKDAQLEYEVAVIYQNVIKNIATACIWYKKAAEKGLTQAAAQLTQMANNVPQQAYDVGFLYENSAPTTVNISQAIRYYMLAAMREHAGARSAVEKLAASGNADAQYALGYDYYRQKNNISEAVKWCMKAAEKNHVPALQYLNTTAFTPELYFAIARRYEQADGVARNMARAMEFYMKASLAGHKEASIYLGQACQMDAFGTPRNLENVWRGYMQAAKLGDESAIAPLKRLAEEMGSERQIELAAFYQLPASKNDTLAFCWYSKSVEVGNARAQQALNLLKLPPAAKNIQVPISVGTSFAKKPFTLGNQQAFGKGLPTVPQAPIPSLQKRLIEKKVIS